MAKLMELEELRTMNEQRLAEEMERIRRHLYDLRCQAVTEKLEDTSALVTSRKNIARIKTVLRERQLKAAPVASPAAKK